MIRNYLRESKQIPSKNGKYWGSEYQIRISGSSGIYKHHQWLKFNILDSLVQIQPDDNCKHTANVRGYLFSLSIEGTSNKKTQCHAHHKHSINTAKWTKCRHNWAFWGETEVNPIWKSQNFLQWPSPRFPSGN